MEKIFQLSWHVPFGSFSVKLDPLSVIFFISVTVLVLCAGVYGIGYMRHDRPRKPLGLHTVFYLALAFSLLIIVTANNIILFLGAWEGMTIFAYLLIIFHDERASARSAGFLYLIASHCATFFLFLMFFIMYRVSGSMDFDVIAQAAFSPIFAGTIFIFSLIGFGVKAGFIPLHIWLPHAHPAAPSHVSAVLSGVMIKMGVYGICRVLWIVKVFPDWCGYLLLSIGVISGVMGVLYAMGQHEIKRLLAYHSIENIGIIVIGLGLGMLGLTYNAPIIAFLGFGGALLHVLNHSLFKGLLFLGAGSVIQKAHSGEMDRMGGLSKTMPVTSALFLVGALSICGLPLFNGFISEFIIYYGLFQGLITLPLNGIIFCALGILSLALMGALALACFSKVYGTVFLGKPRSISIEGGGGDDRREKTSRLMLIPMAVLAGLCIWIGFDPYTVSRLAFSGGTSLMHAGLQAINLAPLFMSLTIIIGSSFLFLALILGVLAIKSLLLGPLPMPRRETWGCGFTQASSRFQYTSSSFARPIIEFAKKALMMNRRGGQVRGHFPGKVHMSSSVHDASEELFFRPLLTGLIYYSRKIDLRRMRHTQMYLMYIFLFLIFLLVWKLK